MAGVLLISGCGKTTDGTSGLSEIELSGTEAESLENEFSEQAAKQNVLPAANDGTKQSDNSPEETDTPDWGITLAAENVTAGGLTIRCIQSGGSPTGELQTGSYYSLEQLVEGEWITVEYLPQEYDIAWTMEAWAILPDSEAKWDVNWEWLYGELPAGLYRIGKEVMDFRETADYDMAMFYAEFAIVDETESDGTENNLTDYTAVEDKVYQNILREIVETGTFPVTEGSRCEGRPYENSYAIMDIDQDGKEELLVNFSNTDYMAGMVLYIYDYNRETEEICIEFAGFPSVQIYGNGFIREDASHNHGKSNLDDFWPYSLWKYDPLTDRYECAARIDAWQYQIAEDAEPDPEFPSEKDLDGDGLVYYDYVSGNYDNPDLVLDNAEYESWCGQYAGEQIIEINWNPIISEEKYLEDFWGL